MRYNNVKKSILKSLKSLCTVSNTLTLILLFGLTTLLNLGHPVLYSDAFSAQKTVKLKPSTDAHKVDEEDDSLSIQVGPVDNSEDDHYFTLISPIETKHVLPPAGSISITEIIFVSSEFLTASQRGPPSLS